MTATARSKDFYKKKQSFIWSGELVKDDFDGTNEITVGNLPENALITRSYVIVKTVTATASTTLKIAAGSTTLVASANITTAAVVSTAHAVDTGAGLALKFTPNKAITDNAVFQIIVEYIEYTLNAEGQQTLT